MLKLKRVELQGFKSFCDRTELKFRGDGIAAIENAVARLEQQAAFNFFRLGTVALVTALDKDRTNFPFSSKTTMASPLWLDLCTVW